MIRDEQFGGGELKKVTKKLPLLIARGRNFSSLLITLKKLRKEIGVFGSIQKQNKTV